MTTEHINRWNSMDDKTFLEHAVYYRKFKNMQALEHSINLDYLNKRLDSLGYFLQPGCCGRNSIVKK